MNNKEIQLDKGILYKQNVNGLLIKTNQKNSSNSHLDVELLSQILTAVINSGKSLQRLPRILTLLEHLEEIPSIIIFHFFFFYFTL